MKKLLIIIVGILVIIGIVYMGRTRQGTLVVVPDQVTPSASVPLKLCFYREKKASSGLSDVSWVSMNLAGEKVTGEFQDLPAEKDKKVGTFEGTVGPVDKMAMARTANVWWSSMAEGMENKEQLRIVFGEGNAQVGYGEMVDRGDGVYVYKDENKLTYGESMTDTDCNDIPMKIAVTKIQGNTCYAYHQVATKDAPYKVDEYINLTVAGDKVSGTKKGTQAGPYMNNGYTGTLKGTLDKSTITSTYSYTVEGAKNNEKEIYNIVAKGLEKLRYPLIEEKGILVPDTTKQAKVMEYSSINCSQIK